MLFQKFRTMSRFVNRLGSFFSDMAASPLLDKSSEDESSAEAWAREQEALRLERMEIEEKRAARKREIEAALGVLGLSDIKRPTEDAEESEWKQYLAKMALIHELGPEAEEIEEERYRQADVEAKLEAIHRGDNDEYDKERLSEDAKLHGKSVGELTNEIDEEIQEAITHLENAAARAAVLRTRFERVLKNRYYTPSRKWQYFWPFSERYVPDGYGALTRSRFMELMNSALELYQRCVALVITFLFHTAPSNTGEGSDYEEKANFVYELNSMLRALRLCFAHPETGEPCNLYAVPSRDGHGRFTLENRETKVRTGGYKSFQELMPITLVLEPPRKEGVIERRKKSRKQSPSGDEEEQTED